MYLVERKKYEYKAFGANKIYINQIYRFHISLIENMSICSCFFLIYSRYN